MALFPCSECSRQISDKAVACPHCGAPVEVDKLPEDFACPGCGHQVDAGASTCDKCKAIFSDDGWRPERKFVKEGVGHSCDQPPADGKKKSSLWKWLIGLPASAFAILMVVGSCAGNTPDGKARANDRSAIEVCWEEQGKRSLDPSTGRFVATTCEKMERDFQKRWGHKP